MHVSTNMHSGENLTFLVGILYNYCFSNGKLNFATIKGCFKLRIFLMDVRARLIYLKNTTEKLIYNSNTSPVRSFFAVV